MLRNFGVSCPDSDTAEFSRPERQLMYAVLERAVRDLTPTVSDDPKHLRSAVLWFRGKTGIKGFTYLDIAEELKLSQYCLLKIEFKVSNAEQYIGSRDRQQAYERAHQLERERKKSRIANRALVERSKVSFRPEKPAVQWNGWNIGYYGS